MNINDRRFATSLLCECSSYRPTALQSFDNGHHSYARFSGPLSDGELFTVKGKKAISSSVATLLNIRSPSAIARFVVSVIVDSVYGLILSAWTHVLEKGGKRISPSFAYFYPTTTPMSKTRAVRVVTSLNHRFPDSMFTTAGLTVCSISKDTNGSGNFFAVTPTRSTGSVSKFRSSDNALVTARASTQPLCRPGGIVFYSPENRPTPKTQSRDVLKLVHKYLRVMREHDNFRTSCGFVQLC